MLDKSEEEEKKIYKEKRRIRMNKFPKDSFA